MLQRGAQIRTPFDRQAWEQEAGYPMFLSKDFFAMPHPYHRDALPSAYEYLLSVIVPWFALVYEEWLEARSRSEDYSPAPRPSSDPEEESRRSCTPPCDLSTSERLQAEVRPVGTLPPTPHPAAERGPPGCSFDIPYIFRTLVSLNLLNRTLSPESMHGDSGLFIGPDRSFLSEDFVPAFGSSLPPPLKSRMAVVDMLQRILMFQWKQRVAPDYTPWDDGETQETPDLTFSSDASPIQQRRDARVRRAAQEPKVVNPEQPDPLLVKYENLETKVSELTNCIQTLVK